MMNVQKGNEAAHEGDRPINKNKRWKLPMKKTRRTLTMILVLAIFLSFALPSGRIYADFENEEETVEETLEVPALEEVVPNTKTKYSYSDALVTVTAEIADPDAIPDDAEFKVTAVNRKTSG